MDGFGSNNLYDGFHVINVKVHKVSKFDAFAMKIGFYQHCSFNIKCMYYVVEIHLYVKLLVGQWSSKINNLYI
jgi:hypothetical protein